MVSAARVGHLTRAALAVVMVLAVGASVERAGRGHVSRGELTLAWSVPGSHHATHAFHSPPIAVDSGKRLTRGPASAIATRTPTVAPGLWLLAVGSSPSQSRPGAMATGVAARAPPGRTVPGLS